MIFKNYTIQIIPEDGEVKEMHLSRKMMVFWSVIVLLVIGTIVYFSVGVGQLIVNKAEYNLLKRKVAYLDNRGLEIVKLNSKIKRLYDIADKLNKALGLEISLDDFFEAEEVKQSSEPKDLKGFETLEEEALILQDFVPNILPTTEGWLSKKFSADHKALDISLKEGTPLYSTMDGTVFSIEDREYLGKTLEIRNDEGFAIVYGHLSKILVREGEEVRKGQQVALSGNSGMSDAPHLHYALQIQGMWVNPINYLLIRR
jgi:murein DD-endopeptidase MepM/ murein hydrolase activator NlpD